MKTLSIQIIEKIIQAESGEDFEEADLFDEILSLFNPEVYYIKLGNWTYSKNGKQIPPTPYLEA